MTKNVLSVLLFFGVLISINRGSLFDHASQSIHLSSCDSFEINIVFDTLYHGRSITCTDANDAIVNVDIHGGNAPYDISWSNGSTALAQSNLSAGVYNVTITEIGGCTAQDVITIPNPQMITITYTTTLISCGISDGQLFLSAHNGSGNYEYSLDSINWQPSGLFTGLMAGTSRAYVRDAMYGCAGESVDIELYEAPMPVITNTTIIHPSSTGGSDGAILVDAQGIGLTLEYRIAGQSWQVDPLFDGLSAGNYMIEVRYQDQSCITSSAFTLTSDGGIASSSSSPDHCSPELSNINNLQVYYLPFAEDHILNALQTITPSSCAVEFSSDPIQNYIYVGIVESGTQVTIDHWEDGFEGNFDFSIQPSTEIWGDNDPTNGIPPGYPIDYFNAGDRIFLNDAVVSTTRQAVVDYDAGDRISSRGEISITRLAWASGSSTLLAGAVEVHERSTWGQQYIIPVGENTDVNDMFSYTGLSVMAGTDNTTIELDLNGDGLPDQTIALNEGESYLQNGGLLSGGTIQADEPVQVHLITGDLCSNYATRWFTLTSQDQWDDGYYVPVSTLNDGSNLSSNSNKPTYVHLYNPNPGPLHIEMRTNVGIIENFTVNSGAVAYREIPEGTGAYLDGNQNFYAIATIDSDPGVNSSNDWGFALLPERLLSPQIYLTGYAPGQNPAFTCNVGTPIPRENYTVSVTSEETLAADGRGMNLLDNDFVTNWTSSYSNPLVDHPHDIIIDLGQTEDVVGFSAVHPHDDLTVDILDYTDDTLILSTFLNTTVVSSFVVPDSVTILDLNVLIDLEHNRLDDLSIELEGPNGQSILLFDRACGTNSDLILSFDDEGQDFDCSQTASNLSFKALSDLQIFDGTNSAGTWTLTVEDLIPLNGGGRLNNWALEILHGKSASGGIKDFELYVSDDGVNWGLPLMERSWSDTLTFSDEIMPAIEARYVRFRSLSDHDNVGVASLSEMTILTCTSSFEENSSPLWITGGHSQSWSDTTDITICVDFNGDGGAVLDATGASFDSSYTFSPLDILKIYDPDGDQTGIRVWVCDGSDGIIAGAWGQDPATASRADPAIDLGVGLINSIPYSAKKCVELEDDIAMNDVYDMCDEVTYSITVKNTGALPLSTGSLYIVDTLSSALDYIDGTSRALVDGITINITDDTLQSTSFPFDEGGTPIDTIILPGDSMVVQFEAIISRISMGTFITNRAHVTNGHRVFSPAVSIPVQDPVPPLDTIIPRDTLVSCEDFIYPDASIDTLSYLSINDTILEGHCLDAFTFQRIFTFTDNCNREYIDTLQITVVDTTPPVIQIPGDTIISINDLPYSWPVGTSDNCDNVTDLTFTDDTTFLDCSYLIERAYRAEDNCSNISFDTARLTVVSDTTTWPIDITVSDTSPCVGDSIHLSAVLHNTDSRIYAAQWYFSPRNDSISYRIGAANTTDYSLVASDTTTGVFEVRYRVMNASDNHCTEHTAQITIEPHDVDPLQIIDRAICEGDSTFFGNRYLLLAGIYFDSLTNRFGCDSIIQLNLTVNPSSINNFDIHLCNGDSTIFNNVVYKSSTSFTQSYNTIMGCDSTISFNLVVDEPEQGTENIQICFGDSTLIDGQYVKTSGDYQMIIPTALGCDSLINVRVDVMEMIDLHEMEANICDGDSIFFENRYLKTAGTYQSTLSSVNGCDSLIQMQLTVNPPTILTGENFEICEGETVQLNITGADEVQWSNTTGFDCETCPHPTVTLFETTGYVAMAPTCGSAMTSIPVQVDVFPIPNVRIQPISGITPGDSITLVAEVDDPNSTLTWYGPTQNILCTDCTSVTTTPEQPGYYTFEASNILGCTDRDSIPIIFNDGCVEGNLLIPNFITPNDDGENDVFTIRWAGIKRAERILIFNRWGELIFTSEQVDEVFWDGTFNGIPVNPDVYVYWLEYYCLNDQLQRRKGNVTVIR